MGVGLDGSVELKINFAISAACNCRPRHFTLTTVNVIFVHTALCKLHVTFHLAPVDPSAIRHCTMSCPLYFAQALI